MYNQCACPARGKAKSSRPRPPNHAVTLPSRPRRELAQPLQNEPPRRRAVRRDRSKTMESIQLQDTGAWRFQVIAAFVIALGLTTAGVFYLPVDAWVKGYLTMGLYFTVSSAFGLAKTLRDAHESHRIVAKISEAKTEKMLRELAQS
jgi:hypothetical protein